MISPTATPAHAARAASSQTASSKNEKGSAFAALVAEAHVDDKSAAPQTPVPAPATSGKSAKADRADAKRDAAHNDDTRSDEAQDTKTDTQTQQAEAPKSHAAKPAKDDDKSGKDETQKDDPADTGAEAVLVQAAPPPSAPIPNIVTPVAGDTAQDSDGDAALAELSQPGKAGTAPQPTKPAAAPAPQAANDNDDADGTAAAAPAATAANKPTQPVQAKATGKDAANDDAKTAMRQDGDPSPAPQAAAQPAPAPQLQPQHAALAVPPAQPAPVQQAQAQLATHVEVAPQTQHTPNLNSLAVEISARSQNGAKQFEIRLDPPELGRVDVRLSIDATGKASAHLSADQAQTLDLLQKDSTSLTRALRDAGLDVAQNGLNFSLRGQTNPNGQQAGGRDGARSRGGAALQATKTIEAAGSSAAYRSSAGDARLDIHV
jgi:flagellar hook-length control protein FliK